MPVELFVNKFVLTAALKKISLLGWLQNSGIVFRTSATFGEKGSPAWRE